MPNNLPLNWCECCIKDIANIQTGKLDANAAVENGKYPFFTCALEPLRINTFSFDGNCIYLPGNGANVGYVGYYQGKFDAYQRTYILDKIAINERYLYFSILLNWKNYNKDKQFGVATNFIRLGNLENYPINLPPLAEQERIVEKIEALFQDIDEGVERLKSAQAQIKQYRQSVLSAAFSGKLYKTTEWKEKKLKDVCTSITDGDHQAPPKTIKGIPFIMISDIRDHKINLYTNNFVKEDYYNNISENRKAHKGDILYSVVGSYGIATLVNITDKFCFQRHIALIKVNIKNITSPFLYHLMNSNNIYKQATICSTGTAQKTVPLSGLRNFSFSLPTLSEQQRIVEEIEKRFAVADVLEKAVNEGLEKADKLKQSILKKAFEGKLAPQNPNDEPASALLDRIKKSQTPTKGKKKC